MLKNYIKIALRNMGKNKFSTFINVTGLAVGMAVAILIGLWIYDELSYNKYFKNYDRVVRIMQHQTFNGNTGTQNSMPLPLAGVLRKDYGNVFKYMVMSSWTQEHILTYRDKKLNREGNYMQEEAPELLTLDMVKGDRNALKDPSSIIINERLAKALFGDEDPMGKAIKMDNRINAKVTGVYKNLPKNTEFNDMDYITTWALYVSAEPWLKSNVDNWGNNSWQVFAQLQPGADLEKVNLAIRDVKLKNVARTGDNLAKSFKPVIFVFPMNRWHLLDEFKNGINTGGRIQFVYMFGIIGIFVILLACINFMNLSTARSERRAKEVGIRKTIGSLRSQLIKQFFSESLLITLFGLALSVVLVLAALPWFNEVADKEMHILWANPLFWVICIVFSLITGLVAGSYPALYLSSFQPVQVLKGTFKAGKNAALPRKILVVLQFTVSITLIIGTIIVFRQVQHTKNRPVGYNRAGIVQILMKTEPVHQHFDAVRTDLLASGKVEEISESSSALTQIWSNWSGFEWKGKAPDLQDDFAYIQISPEFGKVSGWNVIDGRDFIRNNKADSNSMILNESAAKFMNLKHPVGEIVRHGDSKYTIVGVTRDMVMSSPYNPVKPALFVFNREAQAFMTVRVKATVNMSEALAEIEEVFKKYDPEAPFDYKFTDSEYAQKFADEERVGKLSAFFASLAIFISCMGLFGMASFMAEQRTKEIGVRKVLGASVLNIWSLMSKDFVLLVVISLVIASPVAYYFMESWLQNYKYRAELSWWIFAITAIVAILITICTVSFQAIKAALSNPVRSLRSE
ncbi:ABC transporter permease [Mucilaginibacter myungsuensis]|uniref:ABC transporter permease n=1 Tax=Mucilaginibacter myungsuensis TaxID=649104 RepID=A0A929PUZ2_9SPHI|nr:ABC transporter permease [Mucilaginibacter myungsuensis]MBE9660604.1 ABC transporter permease [Mucilaginibacter myungsuensis]MDN3600649.1 ABC transporter permease [Mucilaginibacter myungsuensis]